jgi:hypothetical protein
VTSMLTICTAFIRWSPQSATLSPIPPIGLCEIDQNAVGGKPKPKPDAKPPDPGLKLFKQRWALSEAGFKQVDSRAEISAVLFPAV